MEGLVDGPLEGDTRSSMLIHEKELLWAIMLMIVGVYIGASTLLNKAPNRIHLASDGVSPFNKSSIWYPCSRILASGGATTRKDRS